MNPQRNTWNVVDYRLGGLFLLLILFFAGTSLFRDLYGLEVRNALFAKEMLNDGMSLIPKAMGKPYPDYPGLYFWIETFFSQLFGKVTTFSAVLPSTICAIGSIWVTFVLGCSINRRTGWFSAAILATFPEFWLQASRASIDMLLTLTITASMACLYFSQDHSVFRQRVFTAGAVFFMILAFFSKGPVGIVIVALSWMLYLLLEHRFGTLLRFIIGSGVTAALCISVQLGIVWRTGGAKLVRDVIHMQVTGRLSSPPNHPFYYYVICLFTNVVFWLINTTPISRRRKGLACDSRPQKSRFELIPRHALSRISLCWSFVTFTIFTIASVRHSRYLLPLYPALALLIAGGMDRLLREGKSLFWIWEPLLGGVIAQILLLGTFGAIFLHDHIYKPAVWIVAVVWGWYALDKCTENQARRFGLIALVLAAGLSGYNILVAPELSHRASGRQFTESAEIAVAPDTPVVLYRIDKYEDGVKYAFYSQRSPSALNFVSSDAELKSVPTPFLLIAEDAIKSQEIESLLNGKKIDQVAKGSIRSHQFSAYRISNKI